MLRLALLAVCVAGAAAAPLQPEGCSTYTATPDSTVDSAWCDSMCKAGNCPPTLCQCAGAEGQAAPAAAVVPEVPGVVVPGVVPEVPAALGEEAAVKAEKEVKVDMSGEKNLPFDKAIIGYYGAGPYTPSPFEGTYGDKGPSIADALVAGYNVICLAFADSFTGDGGFQVHTDLCPVDKDHKQLKPPHNHVCAPDKKTISKDAGKSEKSWKYILSFGGAAGPGPKMTMIGDDREASEEAFADGFVKSYMKVKAEYGFDGVDMDIENSLSTELLSALRRVFKKLHDKGEIVSMAPETPSLNPAEVATYIEGAYNSYAPLADTTVINHVSWVAPQMYNDQIPFTDDPTETAPAARYVKSLQQGGVKMLWDGKEIEIKIPANKLVLGFPATPAAGPARAMPAWEEPEQLLELFRNSPDLQAIKGVMTWSIGHDWNNGWKWVNAMKKVWD
jgi:chitinase